MKAVRLATTVLTWAVLLLGLGLAALLVVVPRVTGTIPLTVYTGSMEPTIAAGAIVFIERVPDPTTLQVGDVITFQVAPDVDEYITHRITAVHPDTTPPSFTTKGDNNAGEDLDPVPVGAVRGIVRFDVPYLGDASEFVTSRTGIAVIAVGAGVVLLVTVAAKLLRKDQDDDAPATTSDASRDAAAPPPSARSAIHDRDRRSDPVDGIPEPAPAGPASDDEATTALPAVPGPRASGDPHGPRPTAPSRPPGVPRPAGPGHRPTSSGSPAGGPSRAPQAAPGAFPGHGGAPRNGPGLVRHPVPHPGGRRSDPVTDVLPRIGGHR